MYFSHYRTLALLPGIRDNNWHGICVSWQTEGGSFKVYYEGKLIQEGIYFKTGIQIPSNKTFTAGVGRDHNELYSGQLGHINAWPRVLEHPLLAVLSSKCGVERGDWVSWPMFKEDVHEIIVVDGETCPPSGNLNNSKIFLLINTLNRQLGIRRFIAVKREKFAKAKQITSKLRLALVSGMKNNRIFKDTSNKRLQESSDRK